MWGETHLRSSDAEASLPGIQEILVLLGIAGAVLFGPRLKAMVMQEEVPAEPRRSRSAKRTGLSGMLRLAIVASVLLPGAAALYFEPWHGNERAFLYIGVAPVAVGWATWWIARGFRSA